MREWGSVLLEAERPRFVHLTVFVVIEFFEAGQGKAFVDYRVEYFVILSVSWLRGEEIQPHLRALCILCRIAMMPSSPPWLVYLSSEIYKSFSCVPTPTRP